MERDTNEIEKKKSKAAIRKIKSEHYWIRKN